MKFRSIECLLFGEWHPYKFEDLKTGDVFRFVDGDLALGQPLIARSDAQPTEPRGNWMISTVSLLEAIGDWLDARGTGGLT